MNAEPLLVEIVAYAPTAYYHCTHCEIVWQQTGFSAGVRKEQAAAALPPDLLADYQRVSDWVHGLLAQHGERVAVQVIDAASAEGLWKTLRHGLRRYPAVIVAGRRHFESFDAAQGAIAAELSALDVEKGGSVQETHPVR
jgi:hypothetical protein